MGSLFGGFEFPVLCVGKLDRKRQISLDLHANQTDREASLLNFAREAIARRKASPALLRGDFRLLQADDEVLAFMRGCGEEPMLCVFNLGHRTGRFRFNGPVDRLLSFGKACGEGDELPVLSAYVGRV